MRPSAAIEVGQLWFNHGAIEFEKQVYQRYGVWGQYSLATEDDVYTINMGLGGLLWYSLPEEARSQGTLQQYFLPDLSEASLSVLFTGTSEEPSIDLIMGYFPYKYNPDARNLGEYVFRSRSYPGLVYTGSWMNLNSAGTRLMGLKLTHRHFDGIFKGDLIVDSELRFAPLYDFSFSYLPSLKLGPVEIGAGVNFFHALPVDSKKSDRREQPAPGGYNMYLNSVSHVTYSLEEGMKLHGDTAYYKFDAIKLMGRVSLDLKGLMGYPDIFGAEDLKIFGEVAVLGLENQGSTYIPITEDVNGVGWEQGVLGGYVPDTTGGIHWLSNPADPTGSTVIPNPASPPSVKVDTARLIYQNLYSNIRQRMPIMFGMNLPAFKLLDVLQVQFQYYQFPFVDNEFAAYRSTLPIPSFLPNTIEATTLQPYTADDWKWSVYGTKKIGNAISITGQVASDHFRVSSFEFRLEYESSMKKTSDHWYYMLRLDLGF